MYHITTGKTYVFLQVSTLYVLYVFSFVKNFLPFHSKGFMATRVIRKGSRNIVIGRCTPEKLGGRAVLRT